MPYTMFIYNGEPIPPPSIGDTFKVVRVRQNVLHPLGLRGTLVELIGKRRQKVRYHVKKETNANPENGKV